MEYLSLFSGIGGGDLAHQRIIKHKCKGYVEYEKYPQEILKQRISDGVLDAAPIFGDIRRFISEGYAREYTGMVDGIVGGFPCQPFSNAGKQREENDPRNMWPSTIETIRIIRPEYIFLENVRGLITKKYFGTIIKEISQSGFCLRWCLLGASDIGAPHKRERVWILAHSTSVRSDAWRAECERQKRSLSLIGTGCSWFEEDPAEDEISNSINGRPQNGWPKSNESNEHSRNENIRPATTKLCGCESNRWGVEPRLGRLAHGVPDRVDRIKALGNAQVPYVAASAWNYLIQEFL